MATPPAECFPANESENQSFRGRRAMTADNKPNRRHAGRRTGREAFILMAITLVSAAVGLGLYLQIGLGLMNAGLIAMALYVGLVCAHIFVRRSEAIRELSQEVGRLEGEVLRLARAGQRPPVPVGPGQQLPFPPHPQHAPAAAAHGPRPQQPPALNRQGQHGAPPPPQMQGRPAAPGSDTTRPQPPRVPAAGPHSAGPNQRAGQQPSSGPQEGDPIARFWAVRPTDMAAGQPGDDAAKPDQPPRQPVRQAEGSGVSQGETPAAAQPDSRQRPEPRETASAKAPAPAEPAELDEANVEGDVEAIQDMIRMFSEEIARPRKAPQARSNDAAEGRESFVDLPSEESAISASVGALRAAADEMRRPSDGARTSIEKGVLPPLRVDANSSKPQPPPVGPEHEEVAAMADAIATGQLDVFLEPIVGLADRKARHFDVSLRLRNGDAGSFGPEDYIPMARNAGLLPLVDATRAARAAIVARHMDERGSGGCLFSSITAESLTSARFLEEFAEACRQSPKLRDRLVFSIAQSELRGLSSTQWSTIRQLATSGFRFAIEDVTSLDLDLPDLKAAGFAFMRISGQAMLDGVSSLDGVLSAAELCERLAGTGLTLIAVGLGSEDQLEGVLSAGVPLGQGRLFGVPRPIRAEALRPAARSAAA